MVKFDRALVESLTADALESVRSAGDDCSPNRCAPPAAITLLLRQYAATGRDDLRDNVGAALARAMHRACMSSGRGDSAAWLALLVEAASLSDDERLLMSVGALANAFVHEWPASGSVASILQSVGATIAASGVVEDSPGGTTLLSAAVDEMERVIGLAYTPGKGVVHEIGTAAAGSGTLDDHATAASTLLVAHEATGRLPYGMLADELMQCARRQWWRESNGWSAPFSEACAAARVMCRLAALYRDPDYKHAAILADLDYAADAALALDALDSHARPAGEAALYGLAVSELLAIQSGI
jgi:hypothetical protein